LRTLAQNLDKLPSFDTPIVAYCAIGWRCTIGMTSLSALGWTNVKALVGGSFGGWVEAGYPVVDGPAPEAPALHAAHPNPAMVAHLDEMLSNIPDGWGVITVENLATELVERPDLVLIDLRKASEIEENGHIAFDNQLVIPIEEFLTGKREWPAKDAHIVAYCGTGHRSTIAMAILWSYGYTDVRSMKGGLNEWVKAGFDVEGGMAAAPNLDDAYTVFIGRMVAYNTLSLDNFNEQLAQDPPPFVLDVRQPNELEDKGHIEGAVHIPLRTLAQNLDKLPSFDTPIVAYCAVGWRCTIAMTSLGALGWTDVKALVGGSFGGWLEAGYPVVDGPAVEAPALNAAHPDAAMVAELDRMLSNIPDGWGVITVDALAAEMVERPDLVLIDLRKPAEIAEKGAIEFEGQVAIPMEEFLARKSEWPAADAHIVAYCGTGHRSTMAMAILWSYGYTDVRSMKGGLNEWLKQGYTVAMAQ
jgi:rhodanese-related sulfurtransferase